MVAPRSPKKHNSLSHNNYFDGRNIIHNYVSKTLYPDYVKPISSARNTRYNKSDQGEEATEKRRSPRLNEKNIRRSPRLIEAKKYMTSEEEKEISSKPTKSVKKKQEKIKKKIIVEATQSIKSDIEEENSDYLRISSTEQFIGNLDIMSCKDIKKHLENTELTVEEKIIFIEQNSSGFRQLRSYIKSQHWNLKELRYFFKAGNAFRAILSKQLRDAADFMIPELNEKDPDCIEVNNLLSKYREEVNRKNDPYNLFKAYYTTRNVIKGTYDLILKPTYDYVINPGLKGLYILGAFVAQLFKLGFDIWTWITKDPKTAYFALLTLKVFRNACCRYIGRILREGDYIDKKTLKDYKSNSLDTSLWWDIGNPLAKELALKVTSKATIGLMDKYGKSFTKGVASTLGALGPLGTIAGGALSMVIDVALEETKETLVEATEIAIYQNNVNNAFGMLFDVINPFKCIEKVVEEMDQVELEYEESKKKNDALEQKKKKELEVENKA
jgi:hypothetical protein